MERRAIAIQGTVQGVGFRPYVYHLASALDLGGFVRNETGGVQIEVEGAGSSLDEFVSRLVRNPPPLARIDGWSCETQSPRGDRAFRIDPSEARSTGPVVITPDAATCDACLAELFNPANRRYRYPFLNCTNCGPRLTIVQGAPYDRARTTMAGFIMCPDCRGEYEDPADRRFHAQPNACPICGPRLSILDETGRQIETSDPLGYFVEAIRQGKIGAMKGLGGYHLVCDATNAAAVMELRRRKHRDEKPFAIMVADLAGAEQLCEIDIESRKLLTSPRRPIALLRKRDCYAHTHLAPGNPFLGVMLPYTPLHHLLLDDMDDVPLVMTSGNRSDEPIAYKDDDAVERLRGIADVFLVNNRPIHVRCDDSVTRIIGGQESPVRRSRGYAPQQIPLPMNCPAPILAVGGQLKATFALGSGRRAIISQHMGDLDHFEAYRAFERDVSLYEELFSIHPQYIAHDLHPDYASTRYASQWHTEQWHGLPAHAKKMRDAESTESRAHISPSPGTPGEGRGEGLFPEAPEDLHPNPLPAYRERGPEERHSVGSVSRTMSRDHRSNGPQFGPYKFETIKTVVVQHHHAHMASCMAEHGLAGPVIGVTLDGTGFGTDGAIWGGEFLVGDYRRFTRAAHLRYVGMPGGEQAVREPWRMALAHLQDAGVECSTFESRQSASAIRLVRQMLQRGFNCPPTSSAGRLFDAVAALVGVRDRVSYEGQAAMELEWLASDGQRVPQAGRSNGADAAAYPFDLIDKPDGDGSAEIPLLIDTRPMIRAIAAEVDGGFPPAQIPLKFHQTWVAIIASTCTRIRAASGIDTVVFSGGVFMNAWLSINAAERLQCDGFTVYRHRLVPPNDGGLSLGQLAIAASQLNPA